MPTYYFQQQAGYTITKDPEGSELPNVEAARVVALRSARELLAFAVRWNHGVPDRILVVDENGNEVLKICIAEILLSLCGKGSVMSMQIGTGTNKQLGC